MNVIPAIVALGLLVAGQEQEAGPQAAGGAPGEAVTIQLQPRAVAPAPAPQRFTVRITPQELQNLVELEQGALSPQLRLVSQREATGAVLERISMAALLVELDGYLRETFAGRFDPERDVIQAPVPAARQVRIETPDLPTPTYTGPQTEPLGFLVHEVSEAEFRSLALRVIQTARLLLDSGQPEFDRTTAASMQALAAGEVAALRAAVQNQQDSAAERAAVRARVATALGLLPDGDDGWRGAADWEKETRRFSYVVQDGAFIDRLKPLVERINRDMQLAGFPGPGGLDRPGIYFDAELGDVDILLPEPMLATFLEQADALERRMAEDAVISIEAVRLTDREIVSAALASRVNAQVQGVHDVSRGFTTQRVLREVGLNSLLAIANRELQVRTLEGIAAGSLPEGVTPVQIAGPTLPEAALLEATIVGSSFSVGADDIFFDGREQVTGFSYVGPDGIQHELSVQTVDSLRETWERIERNLIVHKIKKTDLLTQFSVPVGPEAKVYPGIAALISQEKLSVIVATGTGAIEKTEATAGTWLVIEDFEITPIPGSSTTLTDEELLELRAQVLLTMFLRDPLTDSDFKRRLLAAGDPQQLAGLLDIRLAELRQEPIRSGRAARTYGQIFDERFDLVVADEAFLKKERNSQISLTFYSSQGNIVQSPSSTQLGDANDLTSFTTLLRPNVVTPISSFFTKGGTETTGSSPLTGADKGERTDQSKTMTHLVIRARFPTIQREEQDRAEGRFTGYFELPIHREPDSQVDLPFLSSSEHPAERLARLRFGLMFPALDPERVRRPFALLNPQEFPGDVARDAHETGLTRLLFNRKLIRDSPGSDATMTADYGERFIVEVRSLLEYDPDFLAAPGFALRNMTHWNNPDRIVAVLDASPRRFALERLIAMLDELGAQLVPDAFAEDFLAYSPPAGWSDRRIYPLSSAQLTTLRRDVAAHRLRMQELYGDAFLEAICMMLDLGTYRAKDAGPLRAGPFRGYQDLVMFDNSGARNADPQRYAAAHAQFLRLKSGGYKGKLFEPSLLSLEHLAPADRGLVYRGKDILALAPRPFADDRWSND